MVSPGRMRCRPFVEGFVATTLATVAAWAEEPASAEEAPSSPAVEVVVEGERRHPQRGPKDASVAATVVTRDRLQAPGLSAVGALRGTPGLVPTELGGAGSPGTVSLRGASPSQTPIHLAGVRLNDEVSGSVDLGRIPVWFIDRIEVYRGNAPVESDRLGMGGAIFIEPRRPDGQKFELSLLLGSYGSLGASAVSSAGDASDGVVAGVGLGRAENDYPFQDAAGTHFIPDDDTVRRRSRIDAEWLDAWVHARRRIGHTQLALVANHGELERGAQRNESLPVRAAREETSRDLLALTTRTPLPDGEQWLQTESSVLRSRAVYRDRLRELNLGSTLTEVTGTRVDHSLGMRIQPLGNWLIRPTLSFGVERMVRRETREEVAPDEPVLVAHRIDVRPLLGVDASVPRTPLVARLVLALECTSGGLTELELCGSAEPVGRFGPTLFLGPFVAYANVGRYVRTPTLGERFGVSPLLRGNPSLAPERGLNFDLGLRYDHERSVPFWVDAVGFARFADDIVEYVRTQRFVVPQNRARGRYLGLEFAGGVAPLPGVRLDLNLSFVDARDTSPSRVLINDILTLQPRMSAAPALTLEQSFDTLHLEHVALIGRYVYQSNRYAAPAGNALLPEQGSLELQLDAFWLKRQLATRLRFDNALNEQPRLDALGAPLPGRSVYLNIELSH